jgi:hypothetical protein
MLGHENPREQAESKFLASLNQCVNEDPINPIMIEERQSVVARKRQEPNIAIVPLAFHPLSDRVVRIHR